MISGGGGKSCISPRSRQPHQQDQSNPGQVDYQDWPMGDRHPYLGESAPPESWQGYLGTDMEHDVVGRGRRRGVWSTEKALAFDRRR